MGFDLLFMRHVILSLLIGFMMPLVRASVCIWLLFYRTFLPDLVEVPSLVYQKDFVYSLFLVY